MNKLNKLTTLIDTMNPEQFALLVEIVDLCHADPDAREFALNWTGKMKDLPAALRARKTAH